MKNTSIDKKNSSFRLKKIVVWLVITIAAFIMAITLESIYKYVTCDIRIEYIKNLDRGYEFQVINDSPIDKKIDFLRVVQDHSQKPIFKFIKNVYANYTNGTLSIPGGNMTRIPAYNYRAMDGYIVSSNSFVTFKLPPLSARNYLAPEAVIVFIEYKTEASNSFINKFESLFKIMGFSTKYKKKRYLVSEDYWTPIANNVRINPTEIVCRDDDALDKSSMCSN